MVHFRRYYAWMYVLLTLCLGPLTSALGTPQRGNGDSGGSVQEAQSTVSTPTSNQGSLLLRTQPVSHLKWSAQIIPRYFVGTNDINLSVIHPETGMRSYDHYLAPITNSHYSSVYLFADLTAPYNLGEQNGFVYAHFDTGEVYRGTLSSIDENTGETTYNETFLSNENTIGDEFKSHGFIRQLFVSHSLDQKGHTSVRLGRGNPIVGYSLIYNNYSPFAEVKLKSAKASPVPLELIVLGVSPSDELMPSNNFIASAELAIPHTKLGRLSVFAAKLWDESNALSEAFRAAITASISARDNPMNSILTGRIGLFNRLTTFESDSEVNWLGAGYSKTWGNSNHLWLNGAVSSGNVSINMDMSRFLRNLRQNTRGRRLDIEETIDLDLVLNGFAMQAGGTVYLSETWYASCFGLVISGDDGLDSLGQAFSPGAQPNDYSDRFGAFLSIVPYLGHTNIFFNGGLDQGFSNREAAVGGLAGKGVVAAGVSVGGPIWGKFSYQGGPTLLSAMHTGPHGFGNLYGIEFDNSLSYALNEITSIDAQFDVFKTGDFFPQRAWNTQTTIQVSYSPSGQW